MFAIGECLHGTVQAPLVSDLAVPQLMGRYMALSAFSWQVGFTVGPAAGGFLLAAMPTGVWILAAGLCLVAGVASLALEPRLPRAARRSPGPRRRRCARARVESGSHVPDRRPPQYQVPSLPRIKRQRPRAAAEAVGSAEPRLARAQLTAD